MMSVFVAAAAMASQPPRAPVPSSFDLSTSARRTLPRERNASTTPVAPHNLDTRDFAVDMPEVALPLAENGPVILVGAMGGRQGDRYGALPKLAHVALGWTF